MVKAHLAQPGQTQHTDNDDASGKGFKLLNPKSRLVVVNVTFLVSSAFSA